MTTTPPPPSSPDDELLSSILDGTATAEEHARVAADPVLVDRLAAWRDVRDAIAAPVDPLPDATVDQLVDAALETAAVGSTPVASLADSRQRRSDRSGAGWGPAVLGVAAVLLLVLVAVPVLGSLGSVDDDGGDEAATFDAGDDDAGMDAADGSSAPGPESSARPEMLDQAGGDSGEEASSGVAEGDQPRDVPVDLGAHAGPRPLAEAALDAAASAEGTHDPDLVACDIERPVGELTLVGRGTVDDVDHLVEVWWTSPPDEATALVVAPATCAVVDQLTRPR